MQKAPVYEPQKTSAQKKSEQQLHTVGQKIRHNALEKHLQKALAVQITKAIPEAAAQITRRQTQEHTCGRCKPLG